MTREVSQSVVWWLMVVGLICGGGAAAFAQDKPGVETQDLGDGFRAMSVNGGPWAIIDTQTGLIMKSVRGQPFIWDSRTRTYMTMDAEGNPVVGQKGGGGGKADPKMIARMKAFLGQVQKHQKAMDGLNSADRNKSGKKSASKPGGANKKARAKDGWGKKQDPAQVFESLLTRYLKLLGIAGEEAEVLRPQLAAVLRKLDRIRRSTVRMARTGPSAPRPRTGDLPNEIRTYLQTFRAVLKTGDRDREAQLEQSLPAYRAARAKQDAELATLRKNLRELLTVAQIAKLAAVGVLR